MSETNRRCVSAQLPPTLWAKIEALHAEFPGVTKHALLKACLALASEAGTEPVKRYLGKY
jgi:hypothetical protein